MKKINYFIAILAFFTLTNAAHVNSASSDQQDVTTVKRLLSLDSRIDPKYLQVNKKGSTIFISGKVNSLGEKLLIEEIAMGSINKKISTKKIKVVPPAISDAKIKKSIMISVPTHCLVEMNKFNVSVKNGSVVLTGTTNALHHKNMAEYVASYTDGVRSVRNLIKVDTSATKLTDKKIAENLRYRFNQNNIGSRIGISVKNGRVNLKGRVSDRNDKKRILELARTTPGIAEIVDKIRYDYNKRTGINY